MDEQQCISLSKKPTSITGGAGEHYVAYRLSAMGFLVAMTRGGSPCVDLIVATPDGRKTVTIQVKTGNRPCATYKKSPKRNWAWHVGDKANDLRGESAFYAFVDLKTDENKEPCKIAESITCEKPSNPNVFIVPSDVVAKDFDEYQKQKKQTGFWFGFATGGVKDEDDPTWHLKEWMNWAEAWNLISDALVQQP